MSDDSQVGWAILELMGHRKLAGYVSEATLGGGSFLRIDVCGGEADDDDIAHGFVDVEDGAILKSIATQFYSPGSVYAITPCARDLALDLASRNQPKPVARWELPERVPTEAEGYYEDEP